MARLCDYRPHGRPAGRGWLPWPYRGRAGWPDLRARLFVEVLEGRITPATYTVTDTADTGAAGTFRWAITQANATAGADRIEFNIPGVGVHTITPTSVLPTVTGEVTIDGRTQPGFAGKPLIELNGEASSASTITSGLYVSGPNVGIYSLVLNRFSGSGIDYSAQAVNATLIGNYIGTDPTGTLSRGNGRSGYGHGVLASYSGVGMRVVGNVISGNLGSGMQFDGGQTTALGAVIQGNFFGTDPTGTKAVPNGYDGLVIGLGGVTVGGTTAAERNVISGNGRNGIWLSKTAPGNGGVTILGNYIGTDVTGTAKLGNGVGIHLSLATDANVIDNTIGGSAPGAGNLISGNVTAGIQAYNAFGTKIVGNRIGTNAAGTAALGNRDGIQLLQASSQPGYAAAVNTQIGTDGDGVDDDAEGNLISGNTGYGVLVSGVGTDGTRIAGNRIGTNAAGTGAVPNTAAGVLVIGGPRNTIVGTDGNGVGDAAERNVITGNGGHGVWVTSAITTGTVIAGNWIGLDAGGANALGNAGDGVYIFNASGTRVGGPTAAERNVIGRNGGTGVSVSGAPATGTVIRGNYIGTTADGTNGAPNQVHGVSVTTTPGVLIRDNVISANKASGVQVQDAAGTVVVGNRIGTTAAGTAALGNLGSGVSVSGGAVGTIVGTNGDGAGDAAEGNVISGNGTSTSHFGVLVTGAGTRLTRVAGNRIGTNAAGTAAVLNRGGAVAVRDGAADTVVGTNLDGSGDAAEGNLLATGGTAALLITGAGTARTRVAANWIGLNAAGTGFIAPIVPVYSYGIGVGDGATDTRIGGPGGVGPGLPGNVIAGVSNGISIGYSQSVAGAGTVVQGNYIGTDVTGTVGLADPEYLHGIHGFSPGTLIGGRIVGSGPGAEGNVIAAAAREGIYHTGMAGAAGYTIQGNLIGTDVTGTRALGNREGVRVDSTSAPVTIGSLDPLYRNVIAGNRGDGVAISTFYAGPAPANTSVLGNYIGVDVTGAARLGNAGQGVAVTGTGQVVRGNVIGGNASGVSVGGAADGIRVQGNRIGTNAAGTASIANSSVGVRVSGTARNTVVGTDGDGVGDAAEGNQIAGNFSHGVEVSGSGVSGTRVSGNLIGLVADGTTGLPNGGDGVLISAGGTLVGGATAAERNVISKNTNGVSVIGVGATGTVIRGNYIGTDAAGGSGGSTANAAAGVNVVNAFDVQVRDNVISNSDTYGVLVRNAPGAVLTGNRIGTTADGSRAFGNFFTGVFLDGSSGTRVGTNGDGVDDAAEGNLISGNAGDGLRVSGSSQVRIAGNRIGTNAAGTAAVRNGQTGITLLNTFGAVIGTNGDGSPGDAAEGNLISGNGAAPADRLFGDAVDGVLVSGSIAAVITGNRIGTDATGTVALGNYRSGVRLIGSSSTVIGTDANGVSDAFEANLISGNRGDGVTIEGGTGTYVAGNRIGTTAAGTAALGNGGSGVSVSGGAASTMIGGDGIEAAKGNVIAANVGDGVVIRGVTGGRVAGNAIGTDPAGVAQLGNGGVGVRIGAAARGLLVRSNAIGFHPGPGILLDATTGDSFGNVFSQNRLVGNAGLGIDLARNGTADGPNAQLAPPNTVTAGPNRGVNAPVLSDVVLGPSFNRVSGYFAGRPNRAYRIEVFASAAFAPTDIQAGAYLASLDVTTDIDGFASFSIDYPTAGLPAAFGARAATATDLDPTDPDGSSELGFGFGGVFAPSQSTPEAVPVAFRGATAFRIADPNDDGSIYTVTFKPPVGPDPVLGIDAFGPAAAAVTITRGSDNQVTIAGTRAALNAFFSIIGLTYTPNYSLGSATLLTDVRANYANGGSFLARTAPRVTATGPTAGPLPGGTVPEDAPTVPLPVPAAPFASLIDRVVTEVKVDRGVVRVNPAALAAFTGQFTLTGNGTNTLTFEAPVGSGMPAAITSSLQFIPPAQFSGETLLRYTVTGSIATQQQSPADREARTYIRSFVVRSTPVPDEPGVSLPASPLTVTAGGSAPFTMFFSPSADGDGSEAHIVDVYLTSLPAGSRLSAGQSPTAGLFSVRPNELSGLTLSVPSGAAPGSYSVIVQAYTADTATYPSAGTSQTVGGFWAPRQLTVTVQAAPQSVPVLVAPGRQTTPEGTPVAFRGATAFVIQAPAGSNNTHTLEFTTPGVSADPAAAAAAGVTLFGTPGQPGFSLIASRLTLNAFLSASGVVYTPPAYFSGPARVSANIKVSSAAVDVNVLPVASVPQPQATAGPLALLTGAFVDIPLSLTVPAPPDQDGSEGLVVSVSMANDTPFTLVDAAGTPVGSPFPGFPGEVRLPAVLPGPLFVRLTTNAVDDLVVTARVTDAATFLPNPPLLDTRTATVAVRVGAYVVAAVPADTSFEDPRGGLDASLTLVGFGGVNDLGIGRITADARFAGVTDAGAVFTTAPFVGGVVGANTSTISFPSTTGTAAPLYSATYFFLALVPAAQFSGDILYTAAVSGTTPTGPRTYTRAVVYRIRPVADEPPLTAPPAATATPGLPTALGLALGASADADGSEAHAADVSIAGLPAGSALSAGAALGGGVFRVSAAALSGLTVTVPTGAAGGSYSITVVRRTDDSAVFPRSGGGETDVRAWPARTLTLVVVGGGATAGFDTVTAAEGAAVAIGPAVRLADPDRLPGHVHTVVLTLAAGTLAVPPPPAGLTAVVGPTGRTLTITGDLPAITAYLAGGQLRYVPTNPTFSGEIGVTVGLTNDSLAAAVPGYAPAAGAGVIRVLPRAAAVTRPTVTFGTQAGTTIPLAIALPAVTADTDGSETVTAALFSNLPAGVTLTAGTLAAGVWRVPVAALPGLALQFAGSSVAGMFFFDVRAEVTDRADYPTLGTTADDVAAGNLAFVIGRFVTGGARVAVDPVTTNENVSVSLAGAVRLSDPDIKSGDTHTVVVEVSVGALRFTPPAVVASTPPGPGLPPPPAPVGGPVATLDPTGRRLTITGTLSAIVSFLPTIDLVYAPAAFFSGEDVLRVTMTNNTMAAEPLPYTPATGSATIRVRPVVSETLAAPTAALGSQAGTAFPLAVTLPAVTADRDGSEAATAVRVTGVPAGARLSAGADLGGGAWEVPAAQLGGLALVFGPAASPGAFTVLVAAVDTDTATYPSAGTAEAVSALGVATPVSGVLVTSALGVTATPRGGLQGVPLDLGGATAVFDPGAQPGNIHTLTLTAARGTFLVNAAAVPAGLTVTTAGATLTATGPLAALNAFLAAPGGLQFFGGPLFAGTVPLAITFANTSAPLAPAAGATTLAVTPGGPGNPSVISLTAADVTTDEDVPVKLDLILSGPADTSSEALVPFITGVPATAEFTDGQGNRLGVYDPSLVGWVFDRADVPKLTFTPTPGFAGTITLMFGVNRVKVTPPSSNPPGPPLPVPPPPETFTVIVRPRPTTVTLDNGSVAESSPAGTLVGRVRVAGGHTGETFTVVRVATTGYDFTVAADGTVRVGTQVPDFETSAGFDLTVRAEGSRQTVVVRTFRIIITAVNEPPTVAALAPTPARQGTTTPLTGLTVSDPDAGTRPVRVTLSVGHGTLTVAPAAGVTVRAGGPGVVALEGALADLTSLFGAAGAITYQPDRAYAGPDVLTAEADDLGGSGAGGPLTARVDRPFVVVAAADPPLLAVRDIVMDEGRAERPGFTAASARPVGTEVVTVLVTGFPPGIAVSGRAFDPLRNVREFTPAEFAALELFAAQDTNGRVVVLEVTAVATPVGGGVSAQTRGTVRLTVRNVPPTLAGAVAPTSAAPGQPVVFDLGRIADPGAEPGWTTVLDWGDGTVERVRSGAARELGTRAHDYAAAGSYRVRVALTDDDTTTVLDFTATVTADDDDRIDGDPSPPRPQSAPPPVAFPPDRVALNGPGSVQDVPDAAPQPRASFAPDIGGGAGAPGAAEVGDAGTVFGYESWAGDDERTLLPIAAPPRPADADFGRYSGTPSPADLLAGNALPPGNPLALLGYNPTPGAAVFGEATGDSLLLFGQLVGDPPPSPATPASPPVVQIARAAAPDEPEVAPAPEPAGPNHAGWIAAAAIAAVAGLGVAGRPLRGVVSRYFRPPPPR